MRRLGVLALAFALFLLAPPDPALAHGFGRSQNIPLPFWLYLFGINAVVFATFAQVALSVGKEHALRPYPRADLLRNRFFRALASSGPFLLGVRLLSVGLFLLVVLTGLFGEQDPDRNFAPTFVWVIWWVGFSFFTAFVGNVWPLVNPWKILFEWTESLARRMGLGKGLNAGLPYPASLGVWPAVALFVAFAWVEVVFEGAATPRGLALFVLLYSALTWGGMFLFGRDAWQRRGEAFSVFFGVLARFAPTEVRTTRRTVEQVARELGLSERRVRELVRDGVLPELEDREGACRDGCVNCYECFARAAPEDRETNVRPPAVGLAAAEETAPGLMVFVVLMLSTVTYDSLLATPLGAALQGLMPAPRTLGLFVLPLLFLAAYLFFVKLGQLYGGKGVSFGRLAAASVFALVPIAIAYQLAHYYSLLLVQGQGIFALVSDPFGWGWDLFGTADYRVRAGVVDAAFVWYSQVALIIAGHVLAVYLAHVVALRLYRDPMRAARSQYPVAVLMVLYTVFSLWILSQPIVA